MSKRIVKTVSFATSDYERDLLDHATKPENGPFSVYIKRLIEQDRSGVVSITIPANAAQGVIERPQAPVKSDITKKDREASQSFL